MEPIFTAAIAALALQAAPATAQKPKSLSVAFYSYGYAPSPVVLKAGQPVTLVFTNRSGITHEFKAVGFFRSSRILAGNPGGGKVTLKQGQSASITLVPKRGTYAGNCGRFMHTQLGMRSQIYVQ